MAWGPCLGLYSSKHLAYVPQVERGGGARSVSSMSLLLWKNLPRNLLAACNYILLVINLVVNLVTTFREVGDKDTHHL